MYTIRFHGRGGQGMKTASHLLGNSFREGYEVQSAPLYGAEQHPPMTADAYYGEDLVTWIKLHAGETCTDTEIQDFCRDSLAHYKIPKIIRVVDAFPMTATGKPMLAACLLMMDIVLEKHD